MREIKFRGKSTRTGKWVYGHYIKTDRGHFIFPNNAAPSLFQFIHIDPKTVGQFAGFRDKTGKEIYEHDIFTAADGWTGTVAMVNGMWVIGNKDGVVELHWDADGGEAIGNIHEDPELLEK